MTTIYLVSPDGDFVIDPDGYFVAFEDDPTVPPFATRGAGSLPSQRIGGHLAAARPAGELPGRRLS